MKNVHKYLIVRMVTVIILWTVKSLFIGKTPKTIGRGV